MSVFDNNSDFWCLVCNYGYSNKSHFDRHLKTAKHKSNQRSQENMPATVEVDELPTNSSQTPTSEVPNTQKSTCEICKYDIPYQKDQLWAHLKSDDHVRAQMQNLPVKETSVTRIEEKPEQSIIDHESWPTVNIVVEKLLPSEIQKYTLKCRPEVSAAGPSELAIQARPRKMHPNVAKALLSQDHACKACSESFRLKTELKKHFLKKHYKGKIFKCRHCDTVFTKIESWKKHEYHLHTEQARDCEACGKTVLNGSRLYDHWQSKHVKTLGKRSVWLKSMKASVPESSRSKGTVSSNYCGASFESEGQVMNHMMKKHKEDDEDTTTCELKLHEKTQGPPVSYEPQGLLIADVQSNYGGMDSDFDGDTNDGDSFYKESCFKIEFVNDEGDVISEEEIRL